MLSFSTAASAFGIAPAASGGMVKPSRFKAQLLLLADSVDLVGHEVASME
jgi:hypothetical protein